MGSVEKVELVSNGVKVSELIQGYYRCNDWKMNSQSLMGFLKQHVELGMTTVDHAHIYGNPSCEEMFGELLKREPNLRNDIEIVTKCGIITADKSLAGLNYYQSDKSTILQSVDTSLERLNTDYIDVLLLHRCDLLMHIDEVAEAFSQLKKQGKVRSFGVSNFSVTQFNLLQSRLDEPLVTNQIEINPVNIWALEDGTLDIAQQHRIRPMAWSLMAGGRLFYQDTEKNIRLRAVLNEIKRELNIEAIDQVIFAWVRKLPSKPVAIVGSGNIKRVKSAVQSLECELTHEQWYRILAASNGHNVA